MVLSLREKLLIAVMGGLAVILLLNFTVSSLGNYHRDLERRLALAESLMSKAALLDAEMNRNGKRRPTRTRTQSLIALIEQLAAQGNMKDRVQLNRVPLEKTKGVEGIDIRVNELTLDEMVNFIFAIENAKPVLIVEQVEISPSFRTKNKLRLSLRVLGQI